METVVVRSIDALAGLRSDWLQLRENTGQIAPNADPDRYGTVLNHMGNHAQPYVVLVRDKTGPRGALIARLTRRRPQYRVGYARVRGPRLRYLDVLYGGILGAGDPAIRTLLVQHLRNLLGAGVVDIAMLNHVRSDDPLLDELSRGARFTLSVEKHHCFRLVPGSFEQTIEGFSKKHRYNMRRANRLLVEHFGGNVALRVFQGESEAAAFVPRAAAVTGGSYQARLAVGFADTPLWRALLQTEARLGRLRCYWLEARGQPIAHQVGCAYGDTFYLEATSFLPEYHELSPGQVLLVRVLEDLCQAGLGWIDYGFGDAEYKRAYGTHSWDEATLELYGPNARAQVAHLVNRSTAALSRGLQRLMDALRILPTLKRAWRGRLAKASARERVRISQEKHASSRND